MSVATLTKPIEREGARYPKFADKFALLDFGMSPMPAISLYPIPERISLSSYVIDFVGLDCAPNPVRWSDLSHLPRVTENHPLICQIFNWVEEVEWEAVRLVDVLDHIGLETHPEGYLAMYSRDGTYFEGLSMAEARDPRVLLATGLNGQPLPEEYGGPVRLVVPFLQGYKSVKWLGAVRAFRHDPIGIKRLLAQSKTARLAPPWRERFGIVPPAGPASDPEGEGTAVTASEVAVASKLVLP
jgi:DMSO/TMAO reductase YedYZ molybdopterin-dependent catalytic subunit